MGGARLGGVGPPRTAVRAISNALDSSPDGFIVLGADGTITYANPAASTLLGRDDLVGQPLGIPCEPESRTVVEFALSDGTLRLIELTTVPTRSGDESSLVGALRDVTHHFTTADDRLELELLDRRLRLGAMAHDMGNALTVITGMAAVLQGRRENDVDIDVCVDAIARQAAQLRRLVGRLAKQMDLEHGRGLRPDPAAVDIRSALEHLKDYYGAIGVPVEIRGADEVAAWADEGHVEEMLANLLENARKHGVPPVVVDLVVDDGQVLIDVTDQGSGVSEADIAVIWEPHARGTGSSDVPGSGLGLYMLRAVAEANGGSAHYRRAPGGGACFTLTLPSA